MAYLKNKNKENEKNSLIYTFSKILKNIKSNFL